MAVNTKYSAGDRKIDSPTIPRFFWQRVQEWNDRIAMREKHCGLWREITWGEYGLNAKYVGLGLLELGLKKNDRIAIISENNPQWLYTDMGTQSVCGVTVGIYTTSTPEQVAYIVTHSEAKFYVAEDEEQLDKILKARKRLPNLTKIIVIDMDGLRYFKDPMVISFEALLDLGRKMDQKEPDLFEKRLIIPQSTDLAFLVYTSGTTGPPKGAMISHDNVLKTMESYSEVLAGGPNDEILTFLPLCHIAERCLTTIGMLVSGYVCNFAESMETVAQDIREVSPTIFFAVPRIWEKFYSTLILRMKDSIWLEKKAFDWAIKVGHKISGYRLNRQEPPLLWVALYFLADGLVLRNVRRFIGLDRAKHCLSGAAPVSSDLLKFYHGLGLNIRETYGQTESTGGISIHHDGDTKLGTVGRPIPNIEIKIVEDDEIIVKGPNVFLGYFKDTRKTEDTVVNGWLYTGDVGRIDEDGHLVITDRKKDIIITAGGKNITPSEIENHLKFSPYINDAVIIGDRRKYLSSLIMIDEENVMQYAQDKRIPFTTYASLTKNKEILKLIQKEVDEVNKKFARVETIKKFRLIDIQLTADDEEITPTMKLKRNLINEKFKDAIESMY